MSIVYSKNTHLLLKMLKNNNISFYSGCNLVWFSVWRCKRLASPLTISCTTNLHIKISVEVNNLPCVFCWNACLFIRECCNGAESDRATMRDTHKILQRIIWDTSIFFGWNKEKGWYIIRSRVWGSMTWPC